MERPISPGRITLLTMYETESVSVMASGPYLERLENPTPLTQQTVGLMENMRRSALRVVASRGQGLGGHLAVWKFEMAAPPVDARHLLANELLPKATEPVSVVAAHLLAPEVSATRAKDATTEGKATKTVAEVPRWLLLIEAVRPDGLAETRVDLHRRLGEITGTADIQVESYRLAVLLGG